MTRAADHARCFARWAGLARRDKTRRLSEDADRLVSILNEEGIEQLPPPFHATCNAGVCSSKVQIFVRRVLVLSIKEFSGEIWVEETGLTEEFREELEAAIHTAELRKGQLRSLRLQEDTQKVRAALVENKWPGWRGNDGDEA